MGFETGISWCDVTWNPWYGCTRVSPGCVNCYMYADQKRFGRDPDEVTQAGPDSFILPTKYGRDGYKVPAGSLIFTCSWSDFFHPAADEWRLAAWHRQIRQRPDCLFLILTKRPERIADCLPPDWGPNGYPNVVLGISAENQQYLEKRYAALRDVPAYMHMISFEPLLGPISLQAVDPDWMKRGQLWGVIGGESGPGHRPCEACWIENLAAELKQGGALVHVKQDSGPKPGLQGRISPPVWALKERPQAQVLPDKK